MAHFSSLWSVEKPVRT